MMSHIAALLIGAMFGGIAGMMGTLIIDVCDHTTISRSLGGDRR